MFERQALLVRVQLDFDLQRGGAPAKSRTKVPELSKVEWEMLKLLVEGQTNREISDRVHLSQNTIKFHVRQILQKTGSVNRTDLTRHAIQEGWLR